MQPLMGKERRRAELDAFPYWRSALAASALVAGLMLFWAALADPGTGAFRHPLQAASGFIAVFLLLPIVFYADYRFQRTRRTPPASRPRARAATVDVVRS